MEPRLKVQNILPQFSITQTLSTVLSIVQVAIMNNAYSSYFYKGVWKRDWKIFPTIWYSIYVECLSTLFFQCALADLWREYWRTGVSQVNPGQARVRRSTFSPIHRGQVSQPAASKTARHPQLIGRDSQDPTLAIN